MRKFVVLVLFLTTTVMVAQNSPTLCETKIEKKIWEDIVKENEGNNLLVKEITVTPGNIKKSMSFQEMQEVTALKINGYLYRSDFDLSYLFPKLKHLNISNLKFMQGKEVSQYFSINNYVNNLESLIVPHVKKVCVDFPYTTAVCYNSDIEELSVNVQISKNLDFSFMKNLKKFRLQSNSCESLILPESLKSFEFVSNRGNIKIIHAKMKEVIDNEYGFLSVDFKNCILYVPKGSVANYREKLGWRNFYNIIEE